MITVEQAQTTKILMSTLVGEMVSTFKMPHCPISFDGKLLHVDDEWQVFVIFANSFVAMEYREAFNGCKVGSFGAVCNAYNISKEPTK